MNRHLLRGINADETYSQPYPQPYQQPYCGPNKVRGNADNKGRNKVASARWGLLLAIFGSPCSVRITAKHAAPTADPSLSTTRKGSALGAAKTAYTKMQGRVIFVRSWGQAGEAKNSSGVPVNLVVWNKRERSSAGNWPARVVVDAKDSELFGAALVVDSQGRDRPTSNELAVIEPMLGPVEIRGSESVDEREHSIGELCCGLWIVFRDVLDAGLKVRASPRRVDDPQRFNALLIARRTSLADSRSPLSRARSA